MQLPFDMPVFARLESIRVWLPFRKSTLEPVWTGDPAPVARTLELEAVLFLQAVTVEFGVVIVLGKLASNQSDRFAASENCQSPPKTSISPIMFLFISI
jgi:hypothetical protein